MKKLILIIATIIISIELGCIAFDHAQAAITKDMQQVTRNAQ